MPSATGQSARLPVTGTPSLAERLGDRVLAWRDRLLGDPSFRHWALGFPFARRFARRDARRLYDLVAGFAYSQVLAACVRLKVFDALAGNPQTAAALAPRIGLEVEAAERLLRAAVSLGLLSRRSGGRYGLGQLGAAMIDNPGVAAMVEHHALFYADLADPVALLRGEARPTRLGRFWAYAGADSVGALDPAQVAEYSRVMSASQALVAGEVLDAYPFSRHRRLLDVGGGDGTFLLAVAKRCPALELRLFDLPAAAARAAQRFAEAGLGGRAEAAGGDFRRDALPAGADLVTLVRVLFDHDDGTVLAILRAVREALAPEGRLLVAETMAGVQGAEPMGDAYFGLYLYAMGGGRPRTVAEHRALLRRAGFGAVRPIATRNPFHTQLLEAIPAADQR